MKLLTIAIPTFNRANCLDLCLGHFSMQLSGKEEDVDIIVSDNCSTDNTHEVVSSYIKNHPNIRYIRNSSNIGPDNNFIQCYNEANSKYLLIFGDDDIMYDSALCYIVDILKSDDFGAVFLSTTAFKDEPSDINSFIKSHKKYRIYKNKCDFLYKIYIDSTFISSNIINKSLIPKCIDISVHSGTNLVQLGWCMPAYLYNDKHVYIESPTISAKVFNSGGFKFFNVFVNSFLDIILSYNNNGLSKKFYNKFINKLLVQFYPSRILNIRLNNESYEDSSEHIFAIFYEKYKPYTLFWLFVVPSIYLPPLMARHFMRWGKSIHKRYLQLMESP